MQSSIDMGLLRPRSRNDNSQNRRFMRGRHVGQREAVPVPLISGGEL